MSPTGSVNARALGLNYFAFSVQTINLIWGFWRTAICLVCKTAVQTSLWLLFCLFRDSMTIAGDDVHQTQSCFFLWICGRIELQVTEQSDCLLITVFLSSIVLLA